MATSAKMPQAKKCLGRFNSCSLIRFRLLLFHFDIVIPISDFRYKCSLYSTKITRQGKSPDRKMSIFFSTPGGGGGRSSGVRPFLEMSERPFSGKHHPDSVLVTGLDDGLVFNGPARLDNR